MRELISQITFPLKIHRCKKLHAKCHKCLSIQAPLKHDTAIYNLQCKYINPLNVTKMPVHKNRLSPQLLLVLQSQNTIAFYLSQTYSCTCTCFQTVPMPPSKKKKHVNLCSKNLVDGECKFKEVLRQMNCKLLFFVLMILLHTTEIKVGR